MGYTSKKVIFHLKLKFPTFCVGNSLQFFFPIRPSKSPQLGKFPTYRNTVYMFHILLARPRIALAVGWRRLKDRWRGGRTELARGSFRLLIRCHFEIAMCSGQ